MNIAMVNTADFGGGAERSVLSLHTALIARGIRSTLYVGKKHTQAEGVVEIPYVRGIPGSRRLMRLVESATGWQDIYNPSFRGLYDLIPADTDVIHFNNLWGGEDGGGYADLSVLPKLTRRIPGVLTEHQTWSFTGHCSHFRECERWKIGCGSCPDLTIVPAVTRDGTRYNWRRKRRIVRMSNLSFVGISEWVTRTARESPIWAGVAKHTIYEGIDTEVFKGVPQAERHELARAFGIPHDRVKILVTGQTLEGFATGFAPYGIDSLFGLVSKDVTVVLVGRSSPLVAKRLTDAGLSCVAIPFQTSPQDMAKCYSASDVNLSASRVEAFGCIAAESQACETPVVAFDSGGLKEVVRNGIGGLSVPFGDTKGLTTALSQLVYDGGLRRRLGVQGRKFVVENFSVGVTSSKYISLYESLL